MRIKTNFRPSVECLRRQSSSLSSSSSLCLSSDNLSEGCSSRQSKVLAAKSISEHLGQRSGTAWAGRTGEIKWCFRVGGSRCGPWLACLPSWGKRATTLAVLTRFKSQKGFWPRRVTFFSCEMKFSMESARCCCRPKPRPSFPQYFYHSLVSG